MMKTKFLAALSVLALFGLIFFSNCSKDFSPIGPDNNLPKVEVGMPHKIVDEGSYPDWSPDDKWIAYTGWSNGDQNICIIPDTGGTPIQLSNNPVWENHPSWSPDGSAIAFSAPIGTEGNYKIFSIPATGGPITKLTPDSLWVQGCDWSPDGTNIVFDAGMPPDWYHDIWLVRLSDGKITQITNDSTYNGWPKYSPDGLRIAFESFKGTSDSILFQIWTVASDGSDPQQITIEGGEYPCWSPDGKWIAFSCGNDICIIPSEGGEPTRITNSKQFQAFSGPAWSSDGKRIAYCGGGGLWVIPINIRE